MCVCSRSFVAHTTVTRYAVRVRYPPVKLRLAYATLAPPITLDAFRANDTDILLSDPKYYN